MNEEKFERISLLAKYLRNNNIKESKILKKDKFFKCVTKVFDGNNSEYYKILFYKYLNPNYISTKEDLEDFYELRENVRQRASSYLLYLIDFDIYSLEIKLEIFRK